MKETLRRRFIHKTTNFTFQDQTVRFDLSQSLFSSASVDDGSRLLLKYTAQTVALESVQSMLDIGSGVGVLGLSLKKAVPDLHLAVQERDALALAFTRANAERNGVAPVEVITGLGLQNCHGRAFDLILANLPGKAGVPVLQALVRQMPAHLTAQGNAGIVVVKPLTTAVLAVLTEIGSQVRLQTETNTYTILLFQGGEKVAAPADPLAPYWRGQQLFTTEGVSYRLDVVYNLPDFDTVGYETRLAAKMLGLAQLKGRVLFWNPGQGHLPVLAGLTAVDAITAVTVAGRDDLSLQVSVHNLHVNGVTAPVHYRHVPTLADLPQTYDRLVVFPDMDPGVPWSRLLPEVCDRLLAPGGRLLLVAKAGFCGRFLAENRILRPLRQKKYHGLRAMLMEKK